MNREHRCHPAAMTCASSRYANSFRFTCSSRNRLLNDSTRVLMRTRGRDMQLETNLVSDFISNFNEVKDTFTLEAVLARQSLGWNNGQPPRIERHAGASLHHGGISESHRLDVRRHEPAGVHLDEHWGSGPRRAAAGVLSREQLAVWTAAVDGGGKAVVFKANQRLRQESFRR